MRDLSAAHRDRLASIDSLAAAVSLPDDPAATLLTPGGGNAVDAGAVGLLTTTTVDETDISAPWRSLSEHRLDLFVRDTDQEAAARAVEGVLAALEERIGDVAEPADSESSIVVTAAARDAAVVRPLSLHHFTPGIITALRRVSASEQLNSSYPIGLPAGIRIVPAAELDRGALLDAAERAWTSDLLHTRVHARPTARASISHELAGLLDRGVGLSAVALRDQEIIGISLVDSPPEESAMALYTPVRPLAWSRVLWVAPSERGKGLAHALLTDAHGRIAQATLPWAIAQYDALTPMSAYFWSREGYRPLAVRWQRIPARAAC